jgi:hypothetical protein
MERDSFKNALEMIASKKSLDKANNTSDGKKNAVVSSPEAGNRTPSHHGVLPLYSSQKMQPSTSTTQPSASQTLNRKISIDDALKQLENMEESLAKSRSGRQSFRKNSHTAEISSGSPYASGHSNLGASMSRQLSTLSRQETVIPEQVVLAPTNSYARANRPGTSGYTNVHGKIPDSIPEGSREEKPGRLQAEVSARRMEANQKKNQREVTSTEVTSMTQEETHNAPKCMCCVS